MATSDQPPEGGDTPTIGERDASADRPDRDSGPVQRVDSEQLNDLTTGQVTQLIAERNLTPLH
jgi:hypothetical protein